jgi:RimJ/RimL family protein N-acetyltransferase
MDANLVGGPCKDAVMTTTAPVRAERLDLRPVAGDDLAALHALHSDPAVWTHFPAGRHTSVQRTARFVAEAAQSWARDGLGYWSVRLAGDGEAGPVVGVGGCAVRDDDRWNLYYRFAPRVWGSGLATELAVAAIEAAGRVRPELPVVAYLLEHNEGSKRTAERAGMSLVWRGPDAAVPDGIRLVYADRPLTQTALEAVLRHT